MSTKKFYLMVEKDQLPICNQNSGAAMSQYYKPTKIQLHSVVKGDDRYRPKPFPWWAIFLIGACGFGLIKLFASIM